MSIINKVFKKLSTHPITITITLFSAILGIIGFFFFQPSQVQKAEVQNSPGSNLIQNSPGATIIQTQKILQQSLPSKEGAKKAVKEKRSEQNPSSNEAVQQGPDVTLRFVYPKSPALILVNTSDKVARDIKWAVLLWNLDLPTRVDPLPIPVSTFDWIRPHSEGGPTSLFNLPNVTPLLKPGNRLFGSASVSCPDCARGRTFIVYIQWGQGGWFFEVQEEKSGSLIIPNHLTEKNITDYYKQFLSNIPERSRIPIRD